MNILKINTWKEECNPDSTVSHSASFICTDSEPLWVVPKPRSWRYGCALCQHCSGCLLGQGWGTPAWWPPPPTSSCTTPLRPRFSNDMQAASHICMEERRRHGCHGNTQMLHLYPAKDLWTREEKLFRRPFKAATVTTWSARCAVLINGVTEQRVF